MKRSNLLLLALAVAGTAPLALAQVATEAPPSRFDAADTNDDGKVDRAEYDGFVEELVLVYDTNDDGKLARDETDPNADPARFVQIDADKDGFLSVAEIKAFGDSDFDVLDANDDGVVTRDESRQRRGAPVGAAGSDGQCNSLGQNLGRCLEAESLPRPLVQL